MDTMISERWKVGTFAGYIGTPPTFVDALSVQPIDAVHGEIGPHICLLCDLDKVTPLDESRALLIAAAPELLEALKDLLNLISIDELVPVSYMKQAREAIAKASGK